MDVSEKYRAAACIATKRSIKHTTHLCTVAVYCVTSVVTTLIERGRSITVASFCWGLFWESRCNPHITPLTASRSYAQSNTYKEKDTCGNRESNYYRAERVLIERDIWWVIIVVKAVLRKCILCRCGGWTGRYIPCRVRENSIICEACPVNIIPSFNNQIWGVYYEISREIERRPIDLAAIKALLSA